MQDAVQDQDADFIFGRVMPLPGLSAGALQRDRYVADGTVVFGGERQNVGRVVLTEELGVQGLQFSVVRDAAVELASGRDTMAQLFRKRFEAGNVERGRLAPVSYQRAGFHYVVLR